MTAQNDPANPASKRVTENYMDEGGYGRSRTVTLTTPGITAREHAAIALRVPDSGEPWLDDMIRRARRLDAAIALQADDRLVKCVRAMDDTALEVFALHHDLEREEWITELETTAWAALPTELAKITRRLELEAKAIARVRFMQADACLAAEQEGRK